MCWYEPWQFALLFYLLTASPMCLVIASSYSAVSQFLFSYLFSETAPTKTCPDSQVTLLATQDTELVSSWFREGFFYCYFLVHQNNRDWWLIIPTKAEQVYLLRMMLFAARILFLQQSHWFAFWPPRCLFPYRSLRLYLQVCSGPMPLALSPKQPRTLSMTLWQ